MISQLCCWSSFNILSNLMFHSMWTQSISTEIWLKILLLKKFPWNYWFHEFFKNKYLDCTIPDDVVLDNLQEYCNSSPSKLCYEISFYIRYWRFSFRAQYGANFEDKLAYKKNKISVCFLINFFVKLHNI